MMLEIPKLPDSTILLVEVGSTAHGTGLPGGEDRDETGVVVESTEQVLGIGPKLRNVMQRTQPEGSRSGPGDVDRTLYSLRKFLRLCYNGNPSMLMSLWSPVIEITPEGTELREAAAAFVGRHVIPRYRGYMQGQALKLLGLKGGGGHGRRGGGGREELIQEHGFDTKYAMHCARLGFQCRELLTTGRLTLPIEHDYADWLRELRSGRVSFNEWWETVLELDATLEAMESDESLPIGPDRGAIESLSVNIHLSIWDSQEVRRTTSTG
jgi:hypothetical protein